MFSVIFNFRYLFLIILTEIQLKMPRASTGSGGPKFGRGATLKSQSRAFVKRLRAYFEEEKRNGGPLLPVSRVTDRVAAALNIGKWTVSKISSEVTEVTPGKKRPHESPKSNVDGFTETAIRNHVYGYYTRQELPTRKKILSSLREAELFSGGMSTLSVVLKKLGFKWRRINNRKFLMERADIVNWRCNFLRRILKNDFNKIVFLDETWINAGHTVTKSWTDETLMSSRKEPTGKGERLIIVHAGTTQGFVLNAQLIFKSKQQGDYHQEMNSITFKKWFQNLLENISPGSIIVMDNAPYHSTQINRPPSQSSTKACIILWLQTNNIQFDATLKKAELLTIVKTMKPQFKTYELDEIAKSKGHEVLRLPPYHCQFNAIELIWANVKGRVARRNTSFTISEVERLARDAIQEITSEDWKKAIEHTKKIIEEAWHKEGVLEECVDEMIISLGNDGSSSSTETSDGEIGDSDDEDPGDNLPKSSGHELPFMGGVKRLSDSDSDD